MPSTPGSAPDLIARIVGDKLNRALGQPVIIENRPGAGGLINMNQLKQAPADGYTLTIMQGAVAVVTPFTYKAASYDVGRDFDIVGTVGVTPMLFVSNPAFPAKNLAEAIAAAKANPDKVALGSSIRGSIPNLANELLAAKTGAKFQIVPFASSSQGIQATVGGDVSMFSDGVAAVIQLVKSGRLRALAAASETVLPGLEGIPLAKDTVPGFNVYGWFLMAAPKGTPKDIVNRLNKEVNEAVHLPDVVEKFRHLGTYPRSGTVESAQEFVRSETTLFGGIIKTAGIKAE
ncbi:MAG: Bug family tripartite tricarboxylate transporter substrate binding protein [Burkholderiaceae bacterium]